MLARRVTNGARELLNGSSDVGNSQQAPFTGKILPPSRSCPATTGRGGGLDSPNTRTHRRQRRSVGRTAPSGGTFRQRPPAGFAAFGSKAIKKIGRAAIRQRPGAHRKTVRQQPGARRGRPPSRPPGNTVATLASVNILGAPSAGALPPLAFTPRRPAMPRTHAPCRHTTEAREPDDRRRHLPSRPPGHTAAPPGNLRQPTAPRTSGHGSALRPAATHGATNKGRPAAFPSERRHKMDFSRETADQLLPNQSRAEVWQQNQSFVEVCELNINTGLISTTNVDTGSSLVGESCGFAGELQSVSMF